MKTTAEKIVDAILLDLSGRSGVGDTLDAIDKDDFEEFKEELCYITNEVLCDEGHKQ